MLIAFISDIHSNFEAFQTVLSKIEELNVDEIFCCGDIVGYGPEPSECIRIIRDMKIPCTLGNHDLNSVNLEKIAWFNPISAEALVWTNEQLDDEEKEYLSNLPKTIKQTVDGKQLLIVHGSPKNPIYEYVYEENVNEKFVNGFDYDIIALGHTHVPFIKHVENKLIINAGSVGQPRDGNSSACFIIINTEKFNAKIFRVDYDIKSVANKIVKSGLPEFLALRLHRGI